MSNAVLCEEFIYSELAGDPHRADLIEVFLTEVPRRVAQMQHYADLHDWEGLRRIAHHLKGLAVSYGFGELTPLAGQLENNLKDGQPEDVIFADLYVLTEMCGRLRSGLPV